MMRKLFIYIVFIFVVVIGLLVCCNDNDNIIVSKENWMVIFVSDLQIVDKLKEGFGLGFEFVIEFLLCIMFVSGNFEDFDVFYVKVWLGEYIDCDKLVNMIVIVYFFLYMVEVYNELDYMFRLYDYMIVFGNDFILLDVCVEEIEQVCVLLCEYMDDIVVFIEVVNIVVK